jgi:hypothetical protein
VVIAEWVSHHPVPPGDDIYLRVCSQIKCTWEKQPLYYEEKQLDILQEISNKIGPRIIGPVPYVRPD